MESIIDTEAKLDTLLDIIGKMLYILDKRLERREVEINAAYLKQPIPLPWKKQNQPLQNKSNKQDIYDEQHFEE